MSQYNGIYFQARAQVLLGESRSTAAQQQAMLYPANLQDTANEIAWNTWAVYGHVVTPLVSGQSTYVLPFSPRDVRQVSVVDETGNVWPLTYITPNQAAYEFRNQWNKNVYAAYTGLPEYYLIEDQVSINVFPVSDFNEGVGVIVSAYWGVSTWWDPTSTVNSPLPDWANEMFTNGICYRRCREMAANDDSGRYAKLLPTYQAAYMDELKTQVEQAKAATAWTRGGPPPVLGSFGELFGTVGSATWTWYS